MSSLNGALLVDKHAGVTSFGIIELLQKDLQARTGLRRSQLPKLGHGGTLDPFATGLLVVCVGRAVKLARYFLGGDKTYEGIIRFGETTVPGDPTDPVSERSDKLPASLAELQATAARLSQQPYLQTPPMHSAKKRDGKPLYELARAGIEVERAPKLCHLYRFDIPSYTAPRAEFSLDCSSGTYVRALAQDFGRMLGTVAMLDSLRRAKSGPFSVADAWTTARIIEATASGTPWDELPCWVPFDRLLEGYPSVDATDEEARDVIQGRQATLFNILRRAPALPAGISEERASHLAIFHRNRLLAVACREEGVWRLERVFVPEGSPGAS